MNFATFEKNIELRFADIIVYASNLPITHACKFQFLYLNNPTVLRTTWNLHSPSCRFRWIFLLGWLALSNLHLLQRRARTHWDSCPAIAPFLYDKISNETHTPPLTHSKTPEIEVETLRKTKQYMQYLGKYAQEATWLGQWPWWESCCPYTCTCVFWFYIFVACLDALVDNRVC